MLHFSLKIVNLKPRRINSDIFDPQPSSDFDYHVKAVKWKAKYWVIGKNIQLLVLSRAVAIAGSVDKCIVVEC